MDIITAALAVSMSGGGGGGTGTDDYNDLTNKPKINGVALAGNKSLSDIGAAAASETYTDTEVDALLEAKADADDVYTKAETGTELAKKVDKETGKGLSTNDFTDAEKAKLAGAAPQATTYTKGQVDAALAAKLSTADVDDTLSSTSTNPVQNKAVQAPIARLVDAGAKNLLKVTATSSTIAGIVCTVSDGIITLESGTAANNPSLIGVVTAKIPKGTYVLSGCPNGGSDSSYRLDMRMQGTSTVLAIDSGESAEVTLTSDTTCSFYIRLTVNYQVSTPLTFKPMLCTAEGYAISPEFVPYAPSNRELYESKITIEDVFGGGTEILENADLNSLTAHGAYHSINAARSATLSNCPIADSGFSLEVSFGMATIIQNLIPTAKDSAGTFYSRRYQSNTWGSWYKFEGTEVT